MADVNKVILLGRLGADPEIMTMESGTKMARVSLATNEVYRDKNGERVERTEWHRVILWRNRAELAEKYLNKGSQIYVEGRLRTRQYQDKEGNQRYTTEIIGDVVNFAGGRQGGEQQDKQQDPPPADSTSPEAPPEEDDLPF